MSFRLEMLQVARVAQKALGESADLIEEFVRSRQNDDGGFRGREAHSDLYYTVFAIDALSALQAALPEEDLVNYLRTFRDGEGLDFVHLCCLARAWSALPESARLRKEGLEKLFGRIEDCRSSDGGYSERSDRSAATAYGCLLAHGAYADHGHVSPGVDRLAEAVQSLRSEDGGWANTAGMREGTTTAAAAALTLMRHLGRELPGDAGDWILRCAHGQGGFLAFPRAPMPDLLSTAVALHALDGLQRSIEPVREACLDYVDTLWTAEGGFHGNWADEALDCEYTYYGLLALGHLTI